MSFFRFLLNSNLWFSFKTAPRFDSPTLRSVPSWCHWRIFHGNVQSSSTSHGWLRYSRGTFRKQITVSGFHVGIFASFLQIPATGNEPLVPKTKPAIRGWFSGLQHATRSWSWFTVLHGIQASIEIIGWMWFWSQFIENQLVKLGHVICTNNWLDEFNFQEILWLTRCHWLGWPFRFHEQHYSETIRTNLCSSTRYWFMVGWSFRASTSRRHGGTYIWLEKYINILFNLCSSDAP